MGDFLKIFLGAFALGSAMGCTTALVCLSVVHYCVSLVAKYLASKVSTMCKHSIMETGFFTISAVHLAFKLV